MQFKLTAAGTKMPGWVYEGVAHYAARMPRDRGLEVVEVPLGKRTRGSNSGRAVLEEARRMLAIPRPGDQVIALEVGGKQLSSEGLATEMDGWFGQGGDVILMIGGPDGLASECRRRANMEWSLSTLTLPHGLVRVVVAEQLYRAYSILQNHPYHRA